MKLVTNLFFRGNCREAFETYARILKGEIKFMFPFEEALGMTPDSELKGKIMHAWLDVGDQSLMGCDAPTAHHMGMSGFSVAFHTDDADEAARVYHALAEGEDAPVPFGATFWSPAFGMLTDRFGTPWIINTIAPKGWQPA